MSIKKEEAVALQAKRCDLEDKEEELFQQLRIAKQKANEFTMEIAGVGGLLEQVYTAYTSEIAEKWLQEKHENLTNVVGLYQSRYEEQVEKYKHQIKKIHQEMDAVEEILDRGVLYDTNI